MTLTNLDSHPTSSQTDPSQHTIRVNLLILVMMTFAMMTFVSRPAHSHIGVVCSLQFSPPAAATATPTPYESFVNDALRPAGIAIEPDTSNSSRIFLLIAPPWCKGPHPKGFANAFLSRNKDQGVGGENGYFGDGFYVTLDSHSVFQSSDRPFGVWFCLNPDAQLGVDFELVDPRRGFVKVLNKKALLVRFD